MALPPESPRFSVIVPTLNEETHIRRTLTAARAALGEDSERIVVDAGSRDRTVARARPLARILYAPPTRGVQLQRGLAEARGQIVIFLHADTLLERGTGHEILRVLENGQVVGGCCRFAIDRPAPRFDRYRALELAVRLRTRLFRTATGDQVIFARRDALARVGGVPTYPIFEDVELVRALRRIGDFAVLRSRAWTSPRRWEEHGFARTVLLHWGLRIGYWFGIPPERLARRYAHR